MQYSLKLLSYKRELGIDSSAKLQLTAYNSTLSCYIELLILVFGNHTLTQNCLTDD